MLARLEDLLNACAKECGGHAPDGDNHGEENESDSVDGDYSCREMQRLSR